MASCCLIIGPAIQEEYLTNKYPNLNELEIRVLREMLCYIMYDKMGLKFFCFSGPDLFAPYFGELFFSCTYQITCIHTNQIKPNEIINSSHTIKSYHQIK